MTRETRQAGRHHGRRVPSQRQLTKPQQQDDRDRARRADNATLEDQCHPRKIFVGGLPHKTTTQHLREHFADFGSIMDAVVLRWPDGRSRGFGYVTFATAGAAAAALKTTHHVGGRQIDTKRAVPGTNKVFVGGLPHNCTAAELREHFEAFGVVSDAVVMIDPVTNRSRGFGFVCFLSGQEGSESVAAALAKYSNHKIRGKWIEVKSAVSPHLLALNELSSSSTLLESPKCSDASAVEPLDAPPQTLLTPRTRMPLQYCKKEQTAQDSPEEDFCQPWKVPVSLPSKMVSASDPPLKHGTVRRAEDLPTAPACDSVAVPWLSNALGDHPTRFPNCYSEPAFLRMPASLSDACKVEGSSGLFATSEALQQSLAELFKQESRRLKDVQVTPMEAKHHGS
eukprot:CAMPEP_0172721956 /NCGR_PEP_ID=MMETSP1074-20121228/80270_1 /TAXON_ID=2916 /ORGANISM="Ceratium fusus, Strain PA161109" /LENGTH=395 /DNA_ID=CAMNT_0013547829 /DNA_START=22 /DNA_END=1209 /DNA_ORIENTATION=-